MSLSLLPPYFPQQVEELSPPRMTSAAPAKKPTVRHHLSIVSCGWKALAPSPSRRSAEEWSPCSSWQLQALRRGRLRGGHLVPQLGCGCGVAGTCLGSPSCRHACGGPCRLMGDGCDRPHPGAPESVAWTGL